MSSINASEQIIDQASRWESDGARPSLARRPRSRSCTELMSHASPTRTETGSSPSTKSSSSNIRKLPFSMTPTRQTSARWRAEPTSKRHPVRRCHSADDHMKQLKERRDSSIVQTNSTPIVPDLEYKPPSEARRSSGRSSTSMYASRRSSTSMYAYDSDEASDDSSIATNDILDILNQDSGVSNGPSSLPDLELHSPPSQSRPQALYQNPIEQRFLLDLSVMQGNPMSGSTSPRRPTVPVRSLSAIATPVTPSTAAIVAPPTATVVGTANSSWVCNCGEDNEYDFVYCGLCGTSRHPPRWICSSCQFTRNKSGRSFCGGCGVRRTSRILPKAA